MKYTLEEAQNISPYKVAVYGNPAMQDVVWVKGSFCPYWWINNKYVEMSLEQTERLRNKEWMPLENTNNIPKLI